MDRLTFDPTLHKYYLDGAEIPGVTSVIEQQLCPIYQKDSDLMKRAAAFGTAVHLACEYYDKGTLDMDTLDSALLPHLNGWIKFRSEHPGKILFNETKICSYKYRFGGTLDRVIDFGKGPELTDIKTSTTISPAVGPQTASYAMAAKECLGITIKKRLCIQLTEDGYKIKTLTDPSDQQSFIAALSCYNWRIKHGKL